ncbi:type II secretion system minor pseudopilin GspK [Glaciecola petra]|uniref:Type II secretion system minor pseudopilin GspK n=1 Tax=Glaciecola petra TaxID=3075602 RepID=A0ABU2ZRD7_9ALTE|nr:type II secretion system minor pseudopilin GspK [Aestuariibacter sp. P117]MDT0595199.1 type II secretion system minor pseudopilin GspK [Aestuariibacter sp. P117]
MILKHTFKSSIEQQRGVALIVVLLIMALVTVLAVEMSARQQINIARAVNIKTNNQAYWYALGAEEFAKSSLATLKSLTGDNINLSQPWAQEFEYPIEGGFIEAKLSDLQACFNLNAIGSEYTPNASGGGSGGNGGTGNNGATANNGGTGNSGGGNGNPSGGSSGTGTKGEAAQKAFETLLNKFTEDTYLAEVIKDSLIDWIDEDDRAAQLGAEDADYESLVTPYLPANNAMSHISELRLVNGVDQGAQAGWLNDLQKVVCVIPETNIKINVNTITEESAIVLDALLGETADIANGIISTRPEEGFTEIAEFFELNEVQSIQLSAEQRDWFDITTQYFKLNTKAKFQDSQFKMSTVFRVNEDGITIISREFGGAF